ncbi:MAG TPA: type VI secretion system accessory protein TagJ [Terriglobales bacterium]|nr:type VI secretion system accessory protein TagJ [Terriglobales bacterium]
MPVKAKELFEAGKVREAERELTSYLRDHPMDVAQRTFLFELLCFSGEYGRAEKQLSVLSQGNADRELGAVLYYAALHAEKTRHQLFERQEFPKDHAAASFPGTLNGKPFRSLRDADPDIGARLEVFAAGAYLWIPFEHIASLEMEAPRRLRDTLWTPAIVRTGPSFKGTELGEVLIPAIYPFSWKHPNETVWLGRLTDWAADDEGNEYPSGQKMLLLDGEEIPFLEVRSLNFEQPVTQATAD